MVCLCFEDPVLVHIEAPPLPDRPICNVGLQLVPPSLQDIFLGQLHGFDSPGAKTRDEGPIT